MTTTRTDLLKALDRQVPAIADHVSAASLAAVPAFVDLGDGHRNFTVLTITSFVRHVDGSRKALDSAIIDHARHMARCGFDSGMVTHLWRIISRELWIWLTTKSPVILDLQGDGIAVWNDFLATHERYFVAFMDAFFETQTELRAGELACRQTSLASLLAGQSPAQTQSVLTALGIHSDRVLVARCSFSGTAPNDPSDPSSRFQPLIREMQAYTHRLPWTVSDGRLVLCLPHDEGKARESMVRISEHLEPTVRIGISRPWPVTEGLLGAARQAEQALRGTSSTNRLVDFGTLSLVEIAALHLDLRAEDVPRALDSLLAEDARLDHEWLRTAEALARAQGSISKAAADLQVHTNTIYYRMAAAQSFSGLDLRNPGVLADILFIRASRLFGKYMP